MGISCVAWGCVIPSSGPPADGQQHLELRVDGRRSWSAIADLPAATFDLRTGDDGSFGSVRGSTRVNASNGDELEVDIDVVQTSIGAMGRIKVRNLTSGKSVESKVGGDPYPLESSASGRRLRLVADWAAVYDGELYPGTVSFDLTIGAPPTGGGGSAAAEIEDCGASLTVALDATAPSISEGETTTFDSIVRNQPTGSCTLPNGTAVVSGNIALTGGPGGSTTSDVALWLTAGTSVIPSTSGLSSEGSSVPGICPGGSAAGCTSAIQDQVGNVDFPAGMSVNAAEGASTDLAFRYYPTLAPGDLALLAGPVTLHAAVHTDDGLLLATSSVDFSAAPDIGDVELTITSPVTAPVTTSVGTVATGQETEALGIAPYTAAAGDPDASVFTATATGATGSGSTVTGTDSTTVAVTPDSSDRPAFPVTASPDAVTEGVSTEILVVARPTSPPVTPLQASASVDGAAGPTSPLNDTGVGGDEVADDGVYSATLPISAASDVTIVVNGEIEGAPVTGQATVQVLPVGAPLVPTTLPVGPVVVRPDTGSDLAADRLVVRLDDTGTYADVVAVATAVGGTVIGRVSSHSWQIGITPLPDYAAFGPIASAVSAVPHVIGVDLEALGELDAVVPSDPRFGSQWHHLMMRNTQAWLANRGSARPVIAAVLDTGVDLDHPDLASKLVKGRDIGSNDDRPQDVDVHGTHVAGIIGAASNNGTGVAGTSWGARIMPVKVFGSNANSLTQSNVAAGIRYAVDHGAQVINMSLGFYNERNEDVAEALEHAWLSNVVVVATAGNNAVSTRRYPAAFERTEKFSSWLGLFSRTYTTDVIAVGSTNQSDGRSSFSNFAGWVDIAAPGSDIWSTVADDAYDTLSGTSMAAPNIVGVVALVRAQEPSLTTELIRRRLTGTGRDIGNLQIGRRVDTYEATFNGSFELEALETWGHTGDAETVKRLGSIVPQEGSRMARIGTGTGTQASLTKRINVDPAAVQGGNVTLTFKYNYVTEEYPEWVGTAYNDQFQASVQTPKGTTIPIVTEEVNTTAWTAVSGINFPGGDSTVGQSGWKTASVTIPASELQGNGSFLFSVSDIGDSLFDSVTLIDDVELQ